MRENGLNPSLDRQRATNEEVRARLFEITRLGSELRETSGEEWIQRKDGSVADPALKARISEIAALIEPHISLVGEALANGATVEDALHACSELITTHEFELRVAERVADNAQSLGERLQTYPPYTGLLIQTMIESYAAIKYEHGHKKGHEDVRIPPTALIRRDVEKRIPPSAMKIRRAIDNAAPALQVFFSQANAPTVPELKDLLESLQQLAHLASPEKCLWTLNAMGELFAQAIRSEEYVPKLTTFEEIQNIFRKPGKKIEKSRHAVTRGYLEGMLMALEHYQRDVVIRSTLSHCGLPVDVYMDHALTMKSFGPIIDQFEMIQALELEAPGSAEALFRQFGIRWFSRYPVSV